MKGRGKKGSRKCCAYVSLSELGKERTKSSRAARWASREIYLRVPILDKTDGGSYFFRRKYDALWWEILGYSYESGF